jgi:hypothetical protein
MVAARELLNPDRRLSLLTVSCPNCRVVWLAPGVMHGDRHVCKECGLNFVVNKSARRTRHLRSEITQPVVHDSKGGDRHDE